MQKQHEEYHKGPELMKDLPDFDFNPRCSFPHELLTHLQFNLLKQYTAKELVQDLEQVKRTVASRPRVKDRLRFTRLIDALQIQIYYAESLTPVHYRETQYISVDHN